MSVNIIDKYLVKAKKLVNRAYANASLAPVDLEQFWADQKIAITNPFGKEIPQVPFGAELGPNCVFAELGIKEDLTRYNRDIERCLKLNKTYNDKAEKIVGRRLLSETRLDPNGPKYPPIKALHHIFEMRSERDDINQCVWLRKPVDNEDELKALLDRVDKRLENLHDFLLPDIWDEERGRLMAMRHKPPLYRSQRGPVTFATSLYGVENLIFLILDNPDLATRLRDTILKAMLEKVRIQDEEAGYTPETGPRGFAFCDDNCAILNAEMYEFFGYPIVKGIWNVYSPNPKDRRYQHSDSDMAHIIPVLARCNLTGVNFGPNVMIDQIREYMPNTVIYGVLAPFTYGRNEEVNIVAEFLRDYDMAHEKRGWVFSTAGSINNGSRLSGMRLIMAAIQEYGRYDC